MRRCAWYLLCIGFGVTSTMQAINTASYRNKASWSNHTMINHKRNTLSSRRQGWEQFGTWLPAAFLEDTALLRNILPEWNQNQDCLYGQRKSTRPYPNDCYGHSFRQRHDEAFKRFWAQIRGEFQYTFDYVLFDGFDMMDYLPNQFWYLIAYLRHMAINIGDPSKLAPPKDANSHNDGIPGTDNANCDKIMDDFMENIKNIEEKVKETLATLDSDTLEPKDSMASQDSATPEPWDSTGSQEPKDSEGSRDVCPEGQYLEECPDPCNMRRCDDGIPSPPCPPKLHDNCPPPECVCNDGLFMDKDGKCGKKKICCYTLNPKFKNKNKKRKQKGKSAMLDNNQQHKKKSNNKTVVDVDILISV